MPVTRGPARAGAVLTALLLAAAVCNLTTGGAAVALPDIAGTFDAPQATLNLVALGTGLGLAMTVLYAGALGDRYGRVRLLGIGLIGLLVAGSAAGVAPTIEFLMAARVLTGIAAGCAFPTTLALITALWPEGPARVRAIALWTATGAVATVGGSVLSGALVVAFGWRIALLLPVPFAVVALLISARAVPRGVSESDEPVDHLGGVLSVLAVAALVLGLGIVFAPGGGGIGLGLLVASAALLAAFVARQLRVAAPLYDLTIARRRLFWVPAVAGTLAFGALVGAMFVGQQYLQNVLGYDALSAGVALIPAAVALLVCAPPAAALVERGTRRAMVVGYVVLIGAFGTMLTWNETTATVVVGLAFALVGAGASFVMTAASRSLTSSTPVRRVGMASATSDLQTDLGGAVMQALLGAVLAGGFSHVFAGLIATSSDAATLSDDVTRALQSSFASAAHVAASNPAYSAQILEAARVSFVDGAWAAYLVGGVALLAGLVVVAVGLPAPGAENELRRRYRDADATFAS